MLLRAFCARPRAQRCIRDDPQAVDERPVPSCNKHEGSRPLVRGLSRAGLGTADSPPAATTTTTPSPSPECTAVSVPDSSGVGTQGKDETPACRHHASTAPSGSIASAAPKRARAVAHLRHCWSNRQRDLLHVSFFFFSFPLHIPLCRVKHEMLMKAIRELSHIAGFLPCILEPL